MKSFAGSYIGDTLVRLCLFVSVVFVVSVGRGVSAFDRPNIVFVFADDWGWGDLGCHGHPYLKTPNIDRLAREGTDFHRFTVASGVCSPSRTAVMTGHFPARYNINGHFAWVPQNEKRRMPDWLDPAAPLLPRFLKSAGYATAHFGKWHLLPRTIVCPISVIPVFSRCWGVGNHIIREMPLSEMRGSVACSLKETRQEGRARV